MFFLPYAYHVVVFCLSLLFILLFVFLFLVYFLFFVSLLCPSLATMSLLATFLPVFFCLLSIFLKSGYVPGSVWFGSIYLVTTARFVADQSM